MTAFPPTRLLSLALVTGCAWLLLGGAASAAPRVGLDAAVKAPAIDRPSGSLRALCARRARGAARRSAGARQARRRGRAARRRCMSRALRAMRRKRARRSSVVPAVVPIAGPLTIAIDGGYAGWSDSETQQRIELGAAVTRHEWDPMQPVEDQEDVVISAAGEIGTRIHALLGGNDLGDPTHYREWTVAFIRRYGLGGSFWAEHPELDGARFAITTVELGNEPYFGAMSVEEYAAVVGPTLEEIRRLGLPVEVILPSRVSGTDTRWIDGLYERIPDLNSLFYAFAEHPYWYGHDPAEVDAAGPFDRLETLRRRMNEHGAGDKPMFITEYGESTASCGSECVDEAVQADHLTKMIDAVVANSHWGVEMLSVFQLRDRGTADPDRERQFGLLREDGSAKPSYSIVRSAMQRFRG
jgi:hypothetical protein